MTDRSKPAVILPQRLHENTYSVNAVKIRTSFKNATKISHVSIVLFKIFDR